MTTTHGLLALGFAALLASTTFGCSAATSVAPEAPLGHGTIAMSLDTARVAFDRMSEHCRVDAADESTRNNCFAATNVARTVLHDEKRASEILRIRCARFGERHPACLDDASDAQGHGVQQAATRGTASPSDPAEARGDGGV